jgi:hypothetical protein
MRPQSAFVDVVQLRRQWLLQNFNFTQTKKLLALAMVEMMWL